MPKNGSMDVFYRRGIYTETIVNFISFLCGYFLASDWHIRYKGWLECKDKNSAYGGEKFVFKILLITIIAASAELDLLYPKDDSVVNACRHFAMVFHIDYSANTSIPSASGGVLCIHLVPIISFVPCSIKTSWCVSCQEEVLALLWLSLVHQWIPNIHHLQVFASLFLSSFCLCLVFYTVAMEVHGKYKWEVL